MSTMRIATMIKAEIKVYIFFISFDPSNISPASIWLCLLIIESSINQFEQYSLYWLFWQSIYKWRTVYMCISWRYGQIQRETRYETVSSSTNRSLLWEWTSSRNYMGIFPFHFVAEHRSIQYYIYLLHYHHSMVLSLSLIAHFRCLSSQQLLPNFLLHFFAHLFIALFASCLLIGAKEAVNKQHPARAVVATINAWSLSSKRTDGRTEEQFVKQIFRPTNGSSSGTESIPEYVELFTRCTFSNISLGKRGIIA